MKPTRKQTPLLIALEIIGAIVTIIGLCQLPGEIANLINPPTTIFHEMQATTTVLASTGSALLTQYVPTRTALAATPAVQRASLGCARVFEVPSPFDQCDAWASSVATLQPVPFAICSTRSLSDLSLYMCLINYPDVPLPAITVTTTPPPR